MENVFVKALKKELIPALGCTEPVGFALTASTARKYAPGKVKKILMEGSGLMVIGVQSVGIPNTHGKRGGFLSAALGVLAGDPDLNMEVLNNVTDKDVQAGEELVAKLVKGGNITLDMVPGAKPIYLKVTVITDEHTASVALWNEHNGIKYIEADGKIIMDNRDQIEPDADANPYDTTGLNIESIYNFCKTCDIKELDHVKYGIELTKTLCKDGLDQKFGLQLAKTTQEKIESGEITNDETQQVLMWTIAGIDARMGGSDYPAMSNTGSGNQGILCTMPSIAAGAFLGKSDEEVIRAAAFANLVNIYLDYLSREYAHLSKQCYCATVGPTSGACGVAFLHGDTVKMCSDVIRTSLGNLPGMICDGAKPMCALKSYSGLSSAMHIVLISEKGIAATNIEGIVGDTVEETIENIYQLQKACMQTTDEFVFDVKKAQGTII